VNTYNAGWRSYTSTFTHKRNGACEYVQRGVADDANSVEKHSNSGHVQCGVVDGAGSVEKHSSGHVQSGVVDGAGSVESTAVVTYSAG
jgi:hypothetical protein